MRYPTLHQAITAAKKLSKKTNQELYIFLDGNEYGDFTDSYEIATVEDADTFFCGLEPRAWVNGNTVE
jgi:hypothetical protein